MTIFWAFHRHHKAGKFSEKGLEKKKSTGLDDSARPGK
jgi:hypothetical protein